MKQRASHRRRGSRQRLAPVDELRRAAAELGIELRPHSINPDSFWSLLRAIDYPRERVADVTDEAGARAGDLIEELAALDLIDVEPGDVVIAMAGEQSPFPAVIRRLTGALCWRRPSPCGPGIDADRVAAGAAETQVPDGYADKVVLDASLHHLTASSARDFVTEVARILRPGGAAAAFLSLAFGDAPMLRDRLLQPAAAAGLDVTIHQLVDVSEVHPRATTHFGIVLRKSVDGVSMPGETVREVAVAPPAARPRGRGVSAGSVPAMLAPAAVVLAAIAAAVVTFGDLRTPLRPAIALVFLLACPGLALVHMLRLSDTLAELTLAAAVSIACNTLVVGALLLAGVSSSETVLAVLLSLTVAAVVLDVAVSRRDAGIPGLP